MLKKLSFLFVLSYTLGTSAQEYSTNSKSILFFDVCMNVFSDIQKCESFEESLFNTVKIVALNNIAIWEELNDQGTVVFKADPSRFVVLYFYVFPQGEASYLELENTKDSESLLNYIDMKSLFKDRTRPSSLLVSIAIGTPINNGEWVITYGSEGVDTFNVGSEAEMSDSLKSISPFVLRNQLELNKGLDYVFFSFRNIYPYNTLSWEMIKTNFKKELEQLNVDCILTRDSTLTITKISFVDGKIRASKPNEQDLERCKSYSLIPDAVPK